MYLNKYPGRRQAGRAISSRMKDKLVYSGSFSKGKGSKPLDENKENLVMQSVVGTPHISSREI